MSDTPRRPGPESTLDEVRDQLIATATELLQQQGVEIGLGHIRLSDVIEQTPHSRATAYRSLADDELAPQAVLHREVLQRLLVREARAENRDAIVNAIAKEMQHLGDHMTSDEIADRTYAMRSIIRVGAAASFYAVANSTNRAVLVASYGALSSTRVVDWRHAELRRGELNIAELFGEMYTDLSALFGYRLKSSFTILQFATAGAALVEGLAVRSRFSDHLEGLRRPSGRDGEDEDWTLHGLGFEGLYTMFFEPVDADNPFADLTNY